MTKKPEKPKKAEKSCKKSGKKEKYNALKEKPGTHKNTFKTHFYYILSF